VLDARRQELREWLNIAVTREKRGCDGIIVVGHVPVPRKFDSG
jgi:hypothetical protein